MADIESVVLRLASSDLDPDDAASARAEEVEKAKDLIKDSSARRNLAEGAGVAAVEACTSYASYERVLTVLTSALFCETKSEDNAAAVVDNLAELICLLIVSCADSSTLLLSTAETQLRIKSVTVSSAFAKVSLEKKTAGEVLAKCTAKTEEEEKSAGESIAATDQDILAKNKGRSSGSSSRPGAHAVSGDEVAMLDKRIEAKVCRKLSSGSKSGERTQQDSGAAAKNLGRRSIKGQGAEEVPGAVREPSVGGNTSGGESLGSVSSASVEISRLESDVVPKDRASRASGGIAVPPGVMRRGSSATSELTDDMGARGAVRTDLTALEGEVLAKSFSRTISSEPQVPGAHFEHKDGQAHKEHNDDEWDHETSEQAPPQVDDSDDKDAPVAGPRTLVATDRGIVRDHTTEYGQNDGAPNVYANTSGLEPEAGLAVAVAVSCEEENILIPSAVELEPGAKPSITRNRRFRLYACLGFVLLVLIVTIVSVTLTSNKDDSSSTTNAISPAETSIRNQLQIVVGEDKMNDKSSPEAKAADWIIHEDPMQLTSDSPNLIQRYVLALFYISTTQDTPWLSCNRPDEGETSECLFKLLSAVFPFIVYEQIEWYRWLSEEHECDWAGVYCDDTDVVRALELWGQEISGTLPSYFSELTYMQSIALQWNNFHGTLPKEWVELQHLLNIEVHYNWLEGQVPEEWWTASRWALQRLNIAANQFSGTVPSEIGLLSGLKGFHSYENDMTGTLPTELGNVEFLAFTRQGRNFIEGTLPTELGKLDKMQEMWLHRNKITGTIPTELGLMTNLGDIRLHFNPLTGTIPQEIYNLTELKRIDIYDCQLSGTISTEIGNLEILRTFRIRANNFHGTIPTEIGSLIWIEDVWIHRNDFVGQVPAELCARHGSSAKFGLQEVDADCADTLTSDGGIGPPQIECPKGCCRRCCDGNTGICDQ